MQPAVYRQPRQLRSRLAPQLAATSSAVQPAVSSDTAQANGSALHTNGAASAEAAVNGCGHSEACLQTAHEASGNAEPQPCESRGQPCTEHSIGGREGTPASSNCRHAYAQVRGIDL